MKKLNLFTLIVSTFLMILTIHFSAQTMEAQELSPSISCSGGETFYAGEYSLDFVVGEPISETYEMQITMLTQGFLQDIAGPTAIAEIPTSMADLKLFPNPVNHILSFDVAENATIKWYEVVSIFGVSNGIIYCEKSLESIDVSNLKPGLYVLKVGIEAQYLKAKTFIKK